MAVGAFLPPYRWQVWYDGAVASGAKLITALSGTDTPQAVYTDAALTTPHANPVVADANGVFPVIYLSAVAYRMTVTTSTGVTIFPAQDNLYDFGETQFAASGGSALIGFIQSGTGAVARTAQAKMREIISVTDFGTLNQAILRTPATIWFPAGTTYVVSTNITIPAGIELLFSEGAKLSINTGVTVAMATGSYWTAGRWQTISGLGVVTFAAGTVEAVFPEWWAPNTTPGTTDMAAALTTASASGQAVSLAGCKYGVGTANWVIANGDVTAYGVKWTNESSQLTGTEIVLLAAAAKISISGLRCRLSRFTVNGNVTGTSKLANYGIHLADSGGQGGIFEDIEIFACKGTPGIGVATTDRNNNMLFRHLKVTDCNIGVSLIARCEKTTFEYPQCYGNYTYNMQIGDGTAIAESIVLVGGQVATLGTEGGAVTNIIANYVQPLTITGTLFESDISAGSSYDIRTVGTNPSVIQVSGAYLFGNNVVSDACRFDVRTACTFISSTITGYAGGDPISDPSGVSTWTYLNCVVPQLTTNPIPFYQNGIGLVNIDPAFMASMVSKFAIGAADAAYLQVQETSGDNGDVAGLLLGSGSTPTLGIKAGLIFKKSTTSGRGSVLMCLNNTADNSNASASDARVWFNGSGSGGPVSISTGVATLPTVSTSLELQGTTGALLINILTTTQRDALTATNGMLVYNTTDAKFQGYQAGSWQNLI